MNAEQRKRLATLIDEIDEHRAKLEELARAKLEELASQIREIKDEEEEKYNNLPDSLQYSERGNAIFEAVGSLMSALTSLAGASLHVDAYSTSLRYCIGHLNEIEG